MQKYIKASDGSMISFAAKEKKTFRPVTAATSTGETVSNGSVTMTCTYSTAEYEVWESDVQAYTAVAIARSEKGAPAVGAKEPKYQIIKENNKYKVYERHINRRERLGTARSLESAMQLISE